MNLQTFQRLSVLEVAQRVRADGSKVVVFPINGTRRWFALEHRIDSMATYLNLAGRRHIELYQLLFDHGLDTLLTPVFGPDLLERGEGYLQVAAEGLSRLAAHSDFLNFYAAYDVRVNFYGDYSSFFAGTAHAYLVEQFAEIAAQTRANSRHRLFFGVCAHDAVETVARLAVRYHTEHGRAPDKVDLIELYYGQPVGPVDLFIGFDKFSAFDMPLVSTGKEDLYFTVCPSPYLDQQQLREILFDHLYSRRADEPDYGAMAPDDWALMQDFYRLNQGRTLGVGTQRSRSGFWYPLPQVKLPADF